MARNRFPIGLVAGLLLGVVAAFVLSGGSDTRAPWLRLNSRLYWCHNDTRLLLGVPGGFSRSWGRRNECDARGLRGRHSGGKVWQIKEEGRPESIGQVGQ